ncbi:MAG: hypothetical protein DI564_02255 [Rhodanobacter denitrificans]|uniref:3-hydroxymyristoyl/3-hydroxydecanoyl-(Acyl carrier protein) dehydratase n=1 Tax=Rhodanobacter denitrificans TaxID=666685 RepID=A0A2W5KU08_9GAMM|nr:MAG: hypothetical protein DI564_02255 [Rhodanobacter denitrificans]
MPEPDSTSLIDIDATFLPIDQMRQISRITRLDGAHIEGDVDLGDTHWVYRQHFPNDPIFPGTLIIEAAGQLTALWAWSTGQRGRPRLVRANAEFLLPVERDVPVLKLEASVRRKRNIQFAHVHVHADARRVATIDTVLAVLPPA